MAVTKNIETLINNNYEDNINNLQNCICNNVSRLKGYNKQTKQILTLKAYSTLIKADCLTDIEVKTVFNKLKALFNCSIQPQIISQLVNENIIYAGTYTYGASKSDNTYLTSAPPQNEDFDELVNQIQTNIVNYYIETKTAQQVLNTFFTLQSSLLGSHFITVPKSLNINFIFDITNTNVTNAFEKQSVTINNVNYDMFILKQIIQPNTIIYYYLTN